MSTVYSLDSSGELGAPPNWLDVTYGHTHFQDVPGMLCVHDGGEVDHGNTKTVEVGSDNTFGELYTKLKNVQLAEKRENPGDDAVVRVNRMELEQTAIFALTLLQLAVDWEHERTAGFPRLRVEVSRAEAERVQLFLTAIRPARPSEGFSGKQLRDFFQLFPESM